MSVEKVVNETTSLLGKLAILNQHRFTADSQLYVTSQEKQRRQEADAILLKDALRNILIASDEIAKALGDLGVNSDKTPFNLVSFSNADGHEFYGVQILPISMNQDLGATTLLCYTTRGLELVRPRNEKEPIVMTNYLIKPDTEVDDLLDLSAFKQVLLQGVSRDGKEITEKLNRLLEYLCRRQETEVRTIATIIAGANLVPLADELQTYVEGGDSGIAPKAE
jgi:hypothetical protein